MMIYMSEDKYTDVRTLDGHIKNHLMMEALKDIVSRLLGTNEPVETCVRSGFPAPKIHVSWKLETMTEEDVTRISGVIGDAYQRPEDGIPAYEFYLSAEEYYADEKDFVPYGEGVMWADLEVTFSPGDWDKIRAKAEQERKRLFHCERTPITPETIPDLMALMPPDGTPRPAGNVEIELLMDGHYEWVIVENEE